MVYEFAASRTNSLIMVCTFLVVMLLIWGRLGKKFIKKILFGLFSGIIVSAVLFFGFNLPLDKVGIFGILSFLFTAIFKKVQEP